MQWSKPRVVVDTNVLLSSLISPYGLPAEILELVISQKIENYISQYILEEIERVMQRPYFRKFSDDSLDVLDRASVLITPTQRVKQCRDSDDDRILETALVAEAHCIITGDKDLLLLHPWRGIDILTPREFLHHYERHSQKRK